MKKFLLIDGSSIFYRAFYALPNLTAPNGTLTGAVFGFANIILKLIDEIHPAAAAIALDVGKKTFRNQLFDDYKGNRDQMPDELATQFPLLDQFAAALGIKTVGVENFEADDVIGTLSAQASARNFETFIVTGDRDALQLISPTVKVILARNTTSNTVFDADKFIDEYGFAPDKLIDYKALRGDSSDNIPGVKGVGDKTAAKLIQRFGTVENIYDWINAVDSKSVRQKLIDGEDIARLSKKLATIDRNVPDVNFEPDDFSIAPDFQRADDFCNRLALVTVKKKIHSIFDAADNLFGAINTVEEEKLPPYAIELPFVYNLKNIFHANVELDAAEIYDIELMNYLVAPGALVTLRPSIKEVGAQLLEKLRAENMIDLYNRIELPLVKVLADMEDRGIFINIDRLDQKSEELAARLQSIEQNIYDLAGHSFNINSPKQLSEVLFEQLKLPPVKKTKSGFSTDAEVLSELRDKHPIVGALLDYRTLSKLRSTYIDGIRPLIDPKTHRVRTHFNQTVTATGRLSSSDPNLQNIPVRTTEGREIRSLFEAGDGFDCLLSADYSQIELRLLAHMSDDENLIDAFNRGQDVHARTAAEVFNIPIEEITPELRRKAKAVNFGIVYGQSDYGLSKELNISRKEAAEYIERYFARYPGVKKYLDATIESARRLGYVETMFGRRRSLPTINDRNFNRRALAERMAMNTPIQGTAADIIKLAMIETEKNLAPLESRMILQVHDELVIETVESELDRVKEIVRRAMEGAAALKVKLDVDIAVGKNWAEAK